MNISIAFSPEMKKGLEGLISRFEAAVDKMSGGQASPYTVTTIPFANPAPPATEGPKKLTAKEKKALAKKLEGYASEARIKLKDLFKKVGKDKTTAFLKNQFKVDTVGELTGKPDAAEQLQELANACSRLCLAEDMLKKGDEAAPEEESIFS